MDVSTTTGRFGLHEVAGLVLGHRHGEAVPAVVWVSAPIPLSVEEVASMLYSAYETSELVSVDDARRTVCDFAVNGGAIDVAQVSYEVAAERASGDRGAAAHWSACLRMARAAMAPPHDADWSDPFNASARALQTVPVAAPGSGLAAARIAG